MSLELHLRCVGVLLIGLGLSHATFGKRFNWKEEFARVCLLNRQMFYVHCFFIALTVSMMGILCLFFTDVLLEKSRLGGAVLVGLTLFWVCRWLIQFFVYDKSLWRGHAFNTRMHILFSLLWTYLTAVFGWATWRQF